MAVKIKKSPTLKPKISSRKYFQQKKNFRRNLEVCQKYFPPEILVSYSQSLKNILDIRISGKLCLNLKENCFIFQISLDLTHLTHLIVTWIKGFSLKSRRKANLYAEHICRAKDTIYSKKNPQENSVVHQVQYYIYMEMSNVVNNIFCRPTRKNPQCSSEKNTNKLYLDALQ